jgi:FkbM family methyltransferase
MQRIRSRVVGVLPEPIRREIHRRRVRWKTRTFVPRQVTHRYGDTRLRIAIEDPLADGWYDRDYPWSELPDVAVLRNHGITAGATVFDLGAHQGMVALVLADLVGPSGTVIAVEAERHNAAVARRNVALNGAENITIIHAAAAAECGSVRLTEGLNGMVEPGAGFGTVEVPAVTVDSLSAQHGAPNVILIDVEGFELEVLKGARETLLGARPTLSVEVHVGGKLEQAGGTGQEVLDWLRTEGYTVRVLGQEAGHRGEPYRAVEEIAAVDLATRFFALAY